MHDCVAAAAGKTISAAVCSWLVIMQALIQVFLFYVGDRDGEHAGLAGDVLPTHRHALVNGKRGKK
jgi:hypothetical protein